MIFPVCFPRKLPGFYVVVSSLFTTIFTIAYYTLFIIPVFSLILRIALNYYHFSIQQLNHIPHIVSTIGPLVCYYQQWWALWRQFIRRVIGIYLAIVLFLIPLNRDMIWFVSILGILLAVLLQFYGTYPFYQNLSSAIVVALIVGIIVPLIWVL